MRPNLGTIAQSGGSQLPDITTGQRWTGVAVILGMAVAILYIWYRTRFAGLPPKNTDHKDTLWSQLYHNDPARLRIPAGADVTSYRSDLRELVASTTDAAVDKREATVSGALADARASAAQTYAPVLEKLPDSAIRTVELAALVVLLGAPAVSTAAILELLQSDTSGVSLAGVATAVADATVTLATFAVDVFSAFPYAGTLFALGLTVVMVGGEWLYHHWYVTATILVGGAAAIVALDYYRERTFEGAIYEDRRNLGLVVAKRVGLVWVAGITPTIVVAGLGEAAGVAPTVGPVGLGEAAGVGLESVGAALGFLAAAVVAFYYAQLSVREAVRRLQDIAQWGQPLDHSEGSDETLPAGRETTATSPRTDRALAGYLFVRRCLVAAWLLVIPLPVAYAVSGVTTGAYAEVGAAFLAASPVIQVAILACVLAPLFALAYLGRGSADDFLTGLRETWSRRRVRLAAFRRGVPVMAVVAACAIVYSMAQVLWLAVVVSVLVGVVARLVYELLMSAKYRVSMFDRLEDIQRSVLVEAYRLEDADGVERYYARLNGSTEILVDSKAEFADAVIDAHPDAAYRSESVATVPMWRATFALRYGIVDPDESETKLKERVRKRALRELRDEKWSYRSTLEDETAEYPREKLEAVLQWGRRHGVLSVREDASGDDVVLLKRDPWEQGGRSS